MSSRQVTNAEIMAMGCLSAALVLLTAEAMPPGLVATVNVGAPLVLASILALGVFDSVRRIPFPFLVPAVWTRIAIAVYFGFGTIFAAIVGGETREYLRAAFPYDDDVLLRVNLLNAVGSFFVLVGLASANCISSLRREKTEHRLIWTRLGNQVVHAHPSTQRAGRPTYRSRPYAEPATAGSGSPRTVPWLYDQRIWYIGTIWLSIGLSWRVFVDLPSQFGLFEFIVPGSFAILPIIRLAGYVLLLAHRSRTTWWGRRVVVALWLGDIVLGLTTFAKVDTMLLGIAGMLALVLRGATPYQIIAALFALLALYAAVRPIADYGRIRMVERHGTLVGAGFQERLEFIADYLSGERPVPDEGREPWAWLGRLSYAGVQAFLMDQYDRGNRGESGSLPNLLTMIVPRLVWPDKPVITDVGRELNVLMVGNRDSSTAPSVFGEAYWNGGWFLVCAWSLFVGAIIGTFSYFSQRVLETGRVWQLPTVVSAVFLGVSIDCWFGPTYVAGGALLVVVALALAAGERILGQNRGRQATAPRLAGS